MLGLAVTAAGAWAAHAAERRAAADVLTRRAAAVAAAVDADLARYEDRLTLVAAGLAAHDDLTAADFARLTEPLAALPAGAASGIVYVVPAADAEVAAVQAHWRARGADGLVLRPVLPGVRHLFQVLGRSLDGRTFDAGRDVAASPPVARTLAAAARDGGIAASETYVLLKDRDVPPEEQQMSFMLAAPVHRPGGGLEGWAVLGLRGGDLLRAVLSGPAGAGADVTLLADGAGRASGRLVVARVSRGTPAPGAAVQRVEVWVGGRTWTLEVRPVGGGDGHLDTAVMIGGLAATFLLAAFLAVLLTTRSSARRAVAAATRELRRSDEAALQQAALLAAVMDSISDGVGVVDAEGNFLLHNPAARRLLGTALDVDDPVRWQGHYGLYLPDGRTPFPTDELPLVRALRGETSEQVEMVVRAPDAPGPGRPISVSARPLDSSAGVAGAVAVFHDIGARQEAQAQLRSAALELQRSNRDLEQFAYVASHDLQEPLRKVAGFCRLLQSQYEGKLDERADQYLRFAVDGAERMQRLIRDLLEFSRVGQAATTVTEIDLDRCLEAALTNLERAREESGALITADPLPRISGQPTLLTQLLQNLIGNAVKFRAEGRPPRVHLSARRVGDHWEFACRDNGIGIRPEDAEHVFVVFHRASAGQGYEGSGIGLATCRKIVEYHGGRIWVDRTEGADGDHGAGTVIRWTMPVNAPHTPMAAAVGRPPSDVPAGQDRPAVPLLR